MAAIYSGIHLKLKSAQTPWEDKIKLARFAWISSQCLLPNKEQVLLDWCTHALTGWYNKKVDFPQNVLEGLWYYLDDLLHSRKLHSFLKQGKSLSLRLNMAQLLLDRLQDHGQSEAVASVGLSTVLSVCQGILSTPALCSVFTTKYELMVSLLSRLISLACHQLQQFSRLPKSDHELDIEVLQSHHACSADKEDFDISHEDNLQAQSKYNPKSTDNVAVDKLFEVLLHALTCYSSVQRQQANPNRVFTLVTNQLFQPMIFLRHWLSQAALSSSTLLPVSQQMCRDIRTKIDTIIQLALFAPEHMSLYQEELTKVDSGKRVSGPAKGPLRPTTVLLSKLTVQNFCAPSVYYAVKSNIVSVLFKLFVESYGTAKGERNEEQGMLCFFFLASLIDTLDLGLESHLSKNTDIQCPSPQSAPCRPESWSLALLAVDSLLNSALLGDIYNVAADRIRHGEVQLKFYQSLAEMLLKQAQPSIPAWYRCLKNLLCLNHLILENGLEQLLSLAWVNMDSTDSRVLRAKQVTVCSLLQTYTKLRQMPKFFSDLLSVISKTALDQPRPPLLSEEVLSTLRTCLLDTPPSQTVEICSLVLNSIKNHIPPKQTTTDDMNGQNEVAFNADSSLKIMSLSQILHSVLFSLKTLDNGSPLPLVRQSQKLMERMYEVINELQQHLAKVEMKTKPSVQKIPKKVKKGQKTVDSKTNMQFNQNTIDATLLLRYTWVEVDTLFSIHCCKYTSLEPVHQGTSANEGQTTSTSPVMECIQSLLSGEIFPLSAVIASSPFSSLLLRHLVLQQMKRILSVPSMLPNLSSMAVLNQAAHFIAPENEIEKCLSVDQKWDGQLYTVNASSYLVAYWYLVTSNLPLILPYLGDEDLHSFATVLVGSQLMRPTQDKDTLPNCLTVSLISSQLLKSHIFAEIPNLFSSTVQYLLEGVFKVLRTAQRNFDIFQNSSQIQKEMVVELILASLTNDKACVELSSEQTKDILNMLQIVKVLNPDGMSSEDLTSCFLLLVFMLTSTACQTKEDNRDDPSCPLLNGLLEILICLLEGSNFPSVLKFIHGGTLLQAVVSSVLCHSLISAENPGWFDLVKKMQAFINCLLQLIITRSSSVRLNLNQFASFLCSKETTDKLTDRANISTVTAHVLLASLSTFSRTLTSNLGKSKSLDELLTQILTQTTTTLGLAVKSLLKPQAGLNVSSIISEVFVVDVVTVMLNCELSLHSIEENKQTHSISHMPLYQGSSLQVLKEINTAPRPRDFLVSSLQFLSTFYAAVEMMAEKQENNKESKDLDSLFMTILHNLQRLLTGHWMSSTDLHDLEPALQKLLCHLVGKCSSERFNLILLMIKGGLDMGKLRGGNYREVLSTVILIKLLFCCPLPEACFNALWLIASQIISTMLFLVKSSSQDISLNLPFTVPVVATVTTLLRQGEGVIANPHHVTTVLGALQCVPLDRLAPAVYEVTFTALHETLFAIIKCHPQVMLKAAPSFLNVFYRLVASIMQEGKQRKDSDADSAVYLRCSMLVERMYSHIAATSEHFTTLSAFIVAQYVTELQKVTLRPDVKLHLTEGIYMILDLCLEQDIKFLMAGLQTGVREVFNELYSSYNHYHKTQRQGEEKYTV